MASEVSETTCSICRKREAKNFCICDITQEIFCEICSGNHNPDSWFHVIVSLKHREDFSEPQFQQRVRLFTQGKCQCIHSRDELNHWRERINFEAEQLKNSVVFYQRQLDLAWTDFNQKLDRTMKIGYAEVREHLGNEGWEYENQTAKELVKGEFGLLRQKLGAAALLEKLQKSFGEVRMMMESANFLFLQNEEQEKEFTKQETS